MPCYWQWVIAQTVSVLLLTLGSPGDVMPKGGWSHRMCGADSEVASRPYDSIGLQRTCTTLHPPQNICVFHYNITEWFRLERSHAPVPGSE